MASKREREEFARLAAEAMGIKEEVKPVFTPLPGPQTMAYESEADELLFGGAAGGSKTALLIGLALNQHKHSIIFRREYPQLKGIIKDIQGFLGERKYSFNSMDKVFRFDGRLIELGACQWEDDVRKFQGRASDLRAFDELTNFSKNQYKFLSGWARTADPNQRVRVVCASNPPTTPEGYWVKEYWGAWLGDKPRAAPGELLWYATIDGKEEEFETGEPVEFKGDLIYPKSRTFIPARITDNPYLMKTGYMSTLQSLPEPLRSKMLYGDFSMEMEDDFYQIIPTEWVKAAMERWKTQPAPTGPQISTGVDCSRGGKDKSTIAKFYPNWVAPILKYEGKEIKDGISLASKALFNSPNGIPIYVDVCGIGSSVYDSLIQLGSNAFPLNGGEKSDSYDRTGRIGFTNKRAEWHWMMREMLDPAYGSTLALPDDAELLADLTAPRYKFSNWKISVESKDETKRRLGGGRSPDCGEAVIYAVAASSILPVYSSTDGVLW